MTPKLKLTIELIPSTAWNNNLRSLMRPQDWDILRQKVYANYQHRCGICLSSGRLECHEIWQFDNINHIQKLTGLIALCDLCHRVKHIGLSELHADQGKINYDTLVNHFMKINNCDRQTFTTHKNAAFALWEKRSLYQWRLDIGNYQNIGSII